ncbi:MAG TPA: DUF5671 domain-containing protein [Candidatus Paceibacterota bacterium]|nr:DUF5671 domain-containing protein [Candidatus Paceibacterota bacterium]
MENTAKNFALQLGALITMYVSVVALIALLLSIITLLYPDVAQAPYERTAAASTVRYTIATLIVFFPAYVVLTRVVNTMRRAEAGLYLGLTKWLIYLSLLIGGGVLLGDVVGVVNSFLNGELTIRFILKALAVLIVVGAAFTYYLADVRGYWRTREASSLRYGAAVSILVVLAIVYGFTKIEAPSEVREMNIDRQEVADLQRIEMQVENYHQVNDALPESLTDAFGSLPVPSASAGRGAYAYELMTEDTYRLCADFTYPTSDAERSPYEVVNPETGVTKTSYSWDHGAGRWCFERSVAVRPAPVK